MTQPYQTFATPYGRFRRVFVNRQVQPPRRRFPFWLVLFILFLVCIGLQIFAQKNFT